VVPAGGGEPRDLASALPGVALTGGAWSPDGTRIACSGVTAGSEDSDVYIVPLVSGTPTTPTLLVGTAATDGDPDWSPDGSSIAYSSLLDGKASVWIVPAIGGTATKLMEVSSVYSIAPLWSPHGRYITCTCFSGELSRLWLVPAAGNALVKLAEVDVQHAWYPTWSPDGTKIALVSGSKGIVIAANLPVAGD
jgi:TolB protein